MRVLIVAFRKFANVLKVNDSSVIASDRLIYYIIIFQETGKNIVTMVFRLKFLTSTVLLEFTFQETATICLSTRKSK
jgi:hypothetical protein